MVLYIHARHDRGELTIREANQLAAPVACDNDSWLRRDFNDHFDFFRLLLC